MPEDPDRQRGGGEGGDTGGQGAAAERGGAVEEGDGARRVPAPGALGVTVAVKVTDWPKTDGLGLMDREVAVAAWSTLWVNAVEVLVVKSVSPE